MTRTTTVMCRGSRCVESQVYVRFFTFFYILLRSIYRHSMEQQKPTMASNEDEDEDNSRGLRPTLSPQHKNGCNRDGRGGRLETGASQALIGMFFLFYIFTFFSN